MSTEQTLRLAESELQRAQMASDVGALDRLLHTDLIYVGPDGVMGNKATDLAGHRSGAMAIDVLEPLDLEVRVIDGVGITVLTADLGGTMGGAPFAARLRYLRTWSWDGSAGWRVIAADISVVEPTRP